MKKLLLSLFIIFTFGFYATYQKQSESIMLANTKKQTSQTASLSIKNSSAVTQEPIKTPEIAQQTTPEAATTTVSPTNTVSKPTTIPTKTPTKPISTPAPKPTPAPVPAPIPTPVVIKPKGKYKDGSFTGNIADAYYGNVQVQAVISGGKLTDVNILDYPQDRNTSRRINSQALPILVQEAVQAQSANIDAVSGASATSPAFIESLGSALSLAKN